MITSGNTYIKNIYYNGEAIKMVFSCDNYVWNNNNWKWKATYTGGNVRTAACDATSAITNGEITLANLETVEIGDCVTSIGDYAFRDCFSLTSIDIPSGVTSIGDDAFEFCTSLTSCTIGSGVTSIGVYAFQGCSSLTSIDIPDSVTSIGKSAFQGCNVLSTVEIGSGITNIGMGGFAYCSGLTSVTINATTPPTLRSGAFYGSTCPIYVPCDSVNAYKASEDWEDYRTRIQAISGTCPDIKWKATYTGGTVTTAACDASSAITSNEITKTYLETVEIGDCVTIIGQGAFANCSGLTSVTISDSVTTIGGSAFLNCRGLTSIDIPNSITSIGNNAFDGCRGLTSIDIPSGVTSIGWGAFRDCTSLTSITCLATTPPTLGILAFENTNDCPIYVPAASLTAYQSAWSDYASRIQAIQ